MQRQDLDSNPPIFQFPNELVVLILLELNRKDLQQIKLVCWLWKFLAGETEHAHINRKIKSFNGSTLWKYLPAISDEGDISTYVSQTMGRPVAAPVSFKKYTLKIRQGLQNNLLVNSYEANWVHLENAIELSARNILTIQPIYSDMLTIEEFLRLPIERRAKQEELLCHYQNIESGFATFALLQTIANMASIKEITLKEIIELVCDPRFNCITGSHLIFLNEFLKLSSDDTLIGGLIKLAIKTREILPSQSNKYEVILHKLNLTEWLSFLEIDNYVRYCRVMHAIDANHSYIMQHMNAAIVEKMIAFIKQWPHLKSSFLLKFPITLQYLSDEEVRTIAALTSSTLIAEIINANPCFLKRFNADVIKAHIQQFYHTDLNKFFFMDMELLQSLAWDQLIDMTETLLLSDYDEIFQAGVFVEFIATMPIAIRENFLSQFAANFKCKEMLSHSKILLRLLTPNNIAVFLQSDDQGNFKECLIDGGVPVRSALPETGYSSTKIYRRLSGDRVDASITLVATSIPAASVNEEQSTIERMIDEDDFLLEQSDSHYYEVPNYRP